MQIRRDIAEAERELEAAEKDQALAAAVRWKLHQRFEARRQLLDHWWSVRCAEALDSPAPQGLTVHGI